MKNCMIEWKGTWSQLTQEIKRLHNNEQSIWFTGHSLGGALAILAAATLHIQSKEDGVHGIYTFGQPRLGNPEFAKSYNAELREKTYRVVNNNDIIARIPTINYQHVGQLMYFSSDGKLHVDEDLSWWEETSDRILGYFDHILSLIPLTGMDMSFHKILDSWLDSINDHRMKTYEKLSQGVYNRKPAEPAWIIRLSGEEEPASPLPIPKLWNQFRPSALSKKLFFVPLSPSCTGIQTEQGNRFPP